MRRIVFDTEGVSSSCPKSDCGVVTSFECKGCPSFRGYSGFHRLCGYKEAKPTGVRRVKNVSLLKGII